MSVLDAHHPAVQARRPAVLVGTERTLYGWGRTARSRSRVIAPRGEEEVLECLARATRSGVGVIARGAARNYGDASQNDSGEVLDMTAVNRVLAVDRDQGLLTAQGGATLAELMATLAPHGLTLPVVPGTRHVTLAGAIAGDIHGKNHHRDGAFARHVESITLCTPAQGQVEVSPADDAELFYATLGGMGLTGVVLHATVRAEPLIAPWVIEDVDRTNSLEETLALLGGEERRRYSVAWLDLLAGGERFGRAVVSRADPLSVDYMATTPPLRRRSRVAGFPDELLLPPALHVPSGFPSGVLRPATVRTFNELRWRSTPRRARERPQPMAPYFFPLDVLSNWNRLYGKGGLLQYQFVIPTDEQGALLRCFELLRVRKLPVYLAVFKRFGPAFGGPLSFPVEGFTLAIDLPAAAPDLARALDALDEIVAESGGRVYLSKDVRMRRDALARMYPRLDSFRSVRARVDPQGVLRSDLGRRLGLCEESP